MKVKLVRPNVQNRVPSTDWCRFELANKSSDKELTDVYIFDEIGYWGTSADTFIQNLSAIKSNEIVLHINSPGGEVFDGIAIYNAIKQHAATVTVQIEGLAASAASFIAMAGDRVVMTKNAMMMIHDGIGGCYGNAADMRSHADLLDKVSQNIASIYADRSTVDVKAWRKAMLAETWYDASEAVTAGLADEILGVDGEEINDKFDLLSEFKYRNRSEAPSPFELVPELANRVAAPPAEDVATVGDTAGKTATDADQIDEAAASKTPDDDATGVAPDESSFVLLGIANPFRAAFGELALDQSTGVEEAFATGLEILVRNGERPTVDTDTIRYPEVVPAVTGPVEQATDVEHIVDDVAPEVDASLFARALEGAVPLPAFAPDMFGTIMKRVVHSGETPASASNRFTDSGNSATLSQIGDELRKVFM